MATINSINSSFPIGVASGGTGLQTLTAHGILVGEGTSAVNPIVLTAGQFLIGTTAGDPAAAQLTAGTGISITNGSGAVTITATGENPWVDATGTAVALVAGTGYIADNAALVTFTLPSTAAIGDVFEITGKAAGGWKIAQNAGQSINFSSVTTTPGTGGSLASSEQFDTVRMVCVTANTLFNVISSIGNITYV